MSRLILVSNRLPVTLAHEHDRIVLKRSVGGLATGLSGPHEATGGEWVGWPGVTRELSGAELDELGLRLQEQRFVPVELSAEDLAGFYEGFSNGVMWPLFHYMLSHVGHASGDWERYVAVNRRFAEVAASRWRPGDTFWVHDYQLALVPRFLRELRPEARIGFFLHIPFPSSAVFRGLPHAREILCGLLGADLIGFHTAPYLRHFLGSVLRLIGAAVDVDRIEWEGREVHAGSFPMGVDARRFSALAESAEVAELVGELHKSPSERILLGIDRLDYTKGIPRRLLAFERLLEQHPELHGSVRLIQVAVPSRGSVRAYQEIRQRVDGLVGRINGAFGTASWTPVSSIQRGFDARGVVALCRVADVVLVTPIRDGMNLVAKEFIAARNDEDGVLVLSEFAGAAQELGEALIVNPYDIHESAETYYRALSMPDEERRRRMRTMRERVFRHDVHLWVRDFLQRLSETGRGGFRPSATVKSALERARSADELVLLLDYDGTLRRFEDDPDDAAPDAELLPLLEALSRRTRTQLHIVSGRPRAELERWFGTLRVGLHGEHGLWSRFPSEPWSRARFAVPDRMERVHRLLAEYADRVKGAFVERKEVTLAYHWRAADPLFGARQVNELRQHLAEVSSGLGLQVLVGDHVLEVRPAGLSKALAVERVAARIATDPLFLALGDDRTDEDLFAALPEGSIAIRVGAGASSAQLRLEDVEQARAFLRDLREETAPARSPTSAP